MEAEGSDPAGAKVSRAPRKVERGIGEAMERDVKEQLDAAWAEAQALAAVTTDESVAHVFATMPPHLRAQRRAMEEGPRCLR